MSKWGESKSIHAKHIPASSREAVKKRSLGRCERCGGPGSQWHHRRSRSVVEEHRHDPCNGLWLCDTCHRWAHANPAWAMVEGLIVSRTNPTPGNIPVETLWGRVWLTCDGQYADTHPGLSTVETRGDEGAE